MGVWNRTNLLLVAAAIAMIGLFALAVRPDASADQVAVLQLDNGGCAGCAGAITGALEEEPGVVSARFDEASGRVMVAYSSKAVSADALARRLCNAGYCCRVGKIQTGEEYRAAGGDPSALTAVRKSCCSWRGSNR